MSSVASSSDSGWCNWGTRNRGVREPPSPGSCGPAEAAPPSLQRSAPSIYASSYQLLYVGGPVRRITISLQAVGPVPTVGSIPTVGMKPTAGLNGRPDRPTRAPIGTSTKVDVGSAIRLYVPEDLQKWAVGRRPTVGRIPTAGRVPTAGAQTLPRPLWALRLPWAPR